MQLTMDTEPSLDIVDKTSTIEEPIDTNLKDTIDNLKSDIAIGNKENIETKKNILENTTDTANVDDKKCKEETSVTEVTTDSDKCDEQNGNGDIKTENNVKQNNICEKNNGNDNHQTGKDNGICEDSSVSETSKDKSGEEEAKVEESRRKSPVIISQVETNLEDYNVMQIDKLEENIKKVENHHDQSVKSLDNVDDNLVEEVIDNTIFSNKDTINIDFECLKSDSTEVISEDVSEENYSPEIDTSMKEAEHTKGETDVSVEDGRHEEDVVTMEMSIEETEEAVEAEKTTEKDVEILSADVDIEKSDESTKTGDAILKDEETLRNHSVSKTFDTDMPESVTVDKSYVLNTVSNEIANVLNEDAVKNKSHDEEKPINETDTVIPQNDEAPDVHDITNAADSLKNCETVPEKEHALIESNNKEEILDVDEIIKDTDEVVKEASEEQVPEKEHALTEPNDEEEILDVDEIIKDTDEVVKEASEEQILKKENALTEPNDKEEILDVDEIIKDTDEVVKEASEEQVPEKEHALTEPNDKEEIFDVDEIFKDTDEVVKEASEEQILEKEHALTEPNDKEEILDVDEIIKDTDEVVKEASEEEVPEKEHALTEPNDKDEILDVDEIIKDTDEVVKEASKEQVPEKEHALTEPNDKDEILDVDEIIKDTDEVVKEALEEQKTQEPDQLAKVVESKTAPICKLSNTLDILSDDDEESPQSELNKEQVIDTTAVPVDKQCISIEDDDDIMLIDDIDSLPPSINDKEKSKSEPMQPMETDEQKEDKETVDKCTIDLENVTNTEDKEAVETVPDVPKESPKTETPEATTKGESQEGTSEIKPEDEKEKPKDEPKKPLVAENFLSGYKKNLADMTRDDLEEMCILKIVEGIVDRSNLCDIKAKLKTMAQNIEEYKKKAMMLTKQNRDLQLVLKSVKEEQRKNAGTVITPLKITRSVGMQVLMTDKPNMRKKNLTNMIVNNANSNVINKPVNTRTANQSPRQQKVAANQQIPVPRLVPANAVAKPPNAASVSAPNTPKNTNQGLNGMKANTPQKPAEKRTHNRTQSVTVDLTDDEPPAKLISKSSPAPPVRVVAPMMRSQFPPGLNSPRKVYIPISGPQGQNIRPGQTIMLKSVPAPGPRIRGPGPHTATRNLVRMQRTQNRHPAPLPECMKQYQPPNWKALPPAPDLKLSKVENGIVISWKIEGYQEDSYEEIASFQLYAYQETTSPASTALWKKIGDVKALPLPMACTLTQFMAGFKYYFAVRAVDVRSRLGPFSLPGSILLLNKM